MTIYDFKDSAHTLGKVRYNRFTPDGEMPFDLITIYGATVLGQSKTIDPLHFGLYPVKMYVDNAHAQEALVAKFGYDVEIADFSKAGDGVTWTVRVGTP